MANACRLNLSDCLHNGRCLMNDSLNKTYCQCASCYDGPFCENNVWNQIQFNPNFIYLIIYLIILGLSLLNNSLTLELFIRCKHLRSTNCGIYLIVYAVLSLLSSIFLLISGEWRYHSDLYDMTRTRDHFSCYFGEIGYNTLVYLCIWLSACVTFGRCLFFFFGSTINTNRCGSFMKIIVFFALAIGLIIPLFAYNCNGNNEPYIQNIREFCVWFYSIATIITYALAVILMIIRLTLRRHRYDMKKNSSSQTFLKLVHNHLYIFVPPIVYVICFLPYTILTYSKNSKVTYVQCDMSTTEHIVNILIETPIYLPVVLTWAIFVYPSKVYMTEFYAKTWSGKCFARLSMFIKSLIEIRQPYSQSHSYIVKNRENINVFVIEIQRRDEL